MPSPPRIKRRIPKAVYRDRAFKLLVHVWRELMFEYARKSKRILWTPDTALIMKEHTRDRRRLIPEIRNIEHTIFSWLADTTRHPELWSKPLRSDDALEAHTFSTRAQLQRRWTNAQRRPHYRNPMFNTICRTNTRIRQESMQALLDLEWKWLKKLNRAMFPKDPLPPRLTRHARYFRP